MTSTSILYESTFVTITMLCIKDTNRCKSCDILSPKEYTYRYTKYSPVNPKTTILPCVMLVHLLSPTQLKVNLENYLFKLINSVLVLDIHSSFLVAS